MRIGQAQDLPLHGWCRRASVGATLVVARCVENTAHGHLQAVRARYANQALWLEQPLEIPEGAQVQVFIQVQSDEPLSSEEQKRRLEAWLGAIRGISVSLDAIRRETIYED